MTDSRAQLDSAQDLSIKDQLELFGLQQTRRLAIASASGDREKARALSLVEVAHEISSSLPSAGELNFQHAGL
jgi:hypothetical protein